MRRFIFPLLGIFVSSCSVSSVFSSKDPVDTALKACGLGYSAQSAAAFKAAYKYAAREGDAEFTAKWDEFLTTQSMEFIKNSGNSNPELAYKEISEQRQCVKSYVNVERPVSRSEIVSQCSKDIYDRLSGGGRTVLSIKQAIVDEKHPSYSEGKLLPLRFIVDQWGPGVSYKIVGCRISDGRYDDLVPIEP